MLELMVASICLAPHPGCSDGLKAYYASRPRLKLAARELKDNLHPVLVHTAPVLYAAASGRGLTLRLWKRATLRLEQDQTTLNLAWSF